MKWSSIDEAIEMVQRRHNYFPKVFRWRGQRYHVDRVDECWTVSRPGWKRRVERHWFRISCRAGGFEIYQDLESNTWRLGRARLVQDGPGAELDTLSVVRTEPRPAVGTEAAPAGRKEKHHGGRAALVRQRSAANT
jgi:hypothetical protein